MVLRLAKEDQIQDVLFPVRGNDFPYIEEPDDFHGEARLFAELPLCRGDHALTDLHPSPR